MPKNSNESRKYIEKLVAETLGISPVQNDTQSLDTQSLDTIERQDSTLSDEGRITPPSVNAVSSNLTESSLLQLSPDITMFNAIVNFIDEHFYFDDTQQRFFHHGVGIHITLDMMKNFVRFLQSQHYDGFGLYHSSKVLLQQDLVLSIDNSRATQTPGSIFQRHIQIFLPTGSTLKRNLRPQVLAFQFINVLEVMAVLTALWEYDPNYKPDWKIYTVMSMLALAVMRNNYYYVGATAELSREQIVALQGCIQEYRNRLIQAMQEVFFPSAREPGATGVTSPDKANRPLSSEKEKLVDMLLQEITQPRFSERALQEWSSWSGAAVKFSATMAVCLALGFSRPIAIALGVLGGLVQGIDVGYTQNNAIAMVSRGLREYMNGRVPPLRIGEHAINTLGYAIFFHKVANLEILVRGFMSKIAPSAWAMILFDAIRRAFALTNLPVQYGVYGIGFISSCLYACIFSRFSIDQRLAIELPTQRILAGYPKEEIGLNGNPLEPFPLTSWERTCQLFSGAVPLAGITGAIAHTYFDLDLIKSGYQVALPTEIMTMLLLAKFDKFAEFYSQIFECRFVDKWISYLDTPRLIWKIIIAIVSGFVLVDGAYHANNQLVAGPAEIILFLSLTALCAERAPRARVNEMRYMIAPAVLNMVALLTWFNHCLLSLLHTYGLYEKHAPASHSQEFSQDQVRLYHTICVMSLLIGLGGAHASWRATGRHVATLTEKIDITIENVEIHPIASNRFLNAVSGCFGSLFHTVTHRLRHWGKPTEIRSLVGDAGVNYIASST